MTGVRDKVHGSLDRAGKGHDLQRLALFKELFAIPVFPEAMAGQDICIPVNDAPTELAAPTYDCVTGLTRSAFISASAGCLLTWACQIRAVPLTFLQLD